MFQFDYIRPNSLEEVTQLLTRYGQRARLIAGGTDLMVQFRERDKRWKEVDYVIDLTALRKELAKITETDDCILIGALNTHADLEQSLLIRNNLPYLSDACSKVGSPQIRNMGTIGGSICNGSPAADPLPPLIASEAIAVIWGPFGKREIVLSDLFSEKGELEFEQGEFLKEIKVKKCSRDTKTAFVKLGRRKALAISRINAAAALTLDDSEVIIKARICPGCIFRKPDRVNEAENLLLGKKPDETLFKEAGHLVSQAMIEKTGRRWSTEYKEPVVEAIVERALLSATGMEAGNE